jgi:hypothetical protein
MKWLFAEAHVVTVSRNSLFIILHLIRFRQILKTGRRASRLNSGYLFG